MEDILQSVEAFARKAHGDQRRKFADEPYINHPVRVMLLCRNYTTDYALLCAALLHDVLEDTPIGRDAMENFLRSVMPAGEAARTLHLVQELTDVYTRKQYPHWNRRKRRGKETERLAEVSNEAQTIKYADIIDNSIDIDGAEPDFARLFLFECRTLLTQMKRGNAALREKAIATVHRCIQQQTQL